MFGGARAVYLRRLARSPSRMVLRPASKYSVTVTDGKITYSRLVFDQTPFLAAQNAAS
jgi:hypothetical protein